MDASSPLAALTDREREVLSLVAAGLTNAEISDRLGVSFPTAKAHVSAILSKLDVETREEAAQRWRRHRRPGPLRRAVRGLWPLPGIAKVGLGVASASIAGAIAIAVMAPSPAQQVPKNRLEVPLAELTPGEPRAYYPELTRQEPFDRPFAVWVVLQDDGTVRAFLGRDPQSGCTVKLDDDVGTALVWVDGASGRRLTPLVPQLRFAFRSFCSGALFLTTGGPTPDMPWFAETDRGLDSFLLEVHDGKAVIALDRLQLGTCRVPVADGSCSPPGHTVMASILPPPAVGEWHLMGVRP